MSSKKINIGINGFGRIGRLVCRIILGLNDENISIVAINHTSTPKYLAYLFKYDTVHGVFKGDVDYDDNNLIIDGISIRVFSHRDPAEIPWKECNTEYICESTGIFTTHEAASKHLGENGAKYVIISAPPKDDTPMYVMGVNNEEYKGENIISNASCTTNCLGPLAKLLHNKFTIKEGLMTTVHSMTANQNVVDGTARGRKDWRAGRTASQNIIPATTGAAKSIGRVLPELDGKLTGISFRVPTTNVSVIDLTVSFEKKTSMEEVMDYLKESRNDIFEVNEELLVSSDFLGNEHSCIVDKNSSIMLNEHFMKIIAWYDNEWGYSKRIIDLIKWMHQTNNTN